MTDPIILIADDHSMMRKAINLTLEYHLNLRQAFIRGVECCSQLMSELTKKDYTHLILDINLEDGSSLEVLPNIVALYPSLAIAAFTMQPRSVYAEVMRIKFGINHYISKNDTEDEAIAGLKRFFFNKPMRIPPPNNNANSPFNALTERQLEILYYLLKGVTTKEIAANLNIADSTVSELKRRILARTGATNLFELHELATMHKVK